MELARCDEVHWRLSTQEAEAGALHISEASYIVSSKPARGTYEDPVKQENVQTEVNTMWLESLQVVWAGPRP